MTQFYYKLEYGTYFYYIGDQLQFGTDQVAICYSKGTAIWTLHKHGSPQDVKAWIATTKSTELASLFECVELPAGFSVEEINHALNTSGYIQELVCNLTGSN